MGPRGGSVPQIALGCRARACVIRPARGRMRKVVGVVPHRVCAAIVLWDAASGVFRDSVGGVGGITGPVGGWVLVCESTLFFYPRQDHRPIRGEIRPSRAHIPASCSSIAPR